MFNNDDAFFPLQFIRWTTAAVSGPKCFANTLETNIHRLWLDISQVKNSLYVMSNGTWMIMTHKYKEMWDKSVKALSRLWQVLRKTITNPSSLDLTQVCLIKHTNPCQPNSCSLFFRSINLTLQRQLTKYLLCE